MNWHEALILGIVQGLTEFLPVSSSGHLELGKALFQIQIERDLTFTVMVHGATVLSTLIVFRNDIYALLRGLFLFRWNEETKYVCKILISMIPIGLVGLFFRSKVEMLYSGNVFFTGMMLLVTALLLFLSTLIRKEENPVTYIHALIIGLAQVLAVVPGISRSGATIATGLMLGVSKDQVTRFSFLMVLLPVIGANLLDLPELTLSGFGEGGWLVPATGFLGALVAGLFACHWMIRLVRKGKLLYFAVYCTLVGGLAMIIAG